MVRRQAPVLLIAALALYGGRESVQGLPSPPDQAIVHASNRIGYGPRPGDVDRVRAIGLRRYIDDQLHPDRISDSGLTARLAPLTTVAMSASEIAERFERPAIEARQARQQNPDAADPPPMDPVQQRANSLVLELGEQKLLRAVYSERQLQEVLVDFWFNHFNVDARKGRDRFMVTEYERETIRPRVFGSFRDLLGATAKSPAMLFYLDNWMSIGTGLGVRNFRDPSPSRPTGLNENYGRELMELHTLGVDGGYTQKDVTEVARAFTGWTMPGPKQGNGFMFNPRLHDPGGKIVLGHLIKAGGGESDGETVLDILAQHPSTATFIATKLVRRFVSDTPPPGLVARVAARFRDTNGDLREVTRAILTSPEFLSPETFNAKVKTPFEFVASMLRATGADVQDALPLVRTLQQLGMPLYQCQPPTGYNDTADAWMNTGALVGRMNFAARLAAGRVPGTAIASAEPASQLALRLGGPEFQRK